MTSEAQQSSMSPSHEDAALGDGDRRSARAPFRDSLRSGRELLGVFVIELAAPAVADAAAIAGFDFAVLDLEHSAFGLSELARLVRCMQEAGVAAVVRVPDHSRAWITRVADMSPDGIMVPDVDSIETAAAIVAAAKYAPLGRRGVAPMVRYEQFEGDRYAQLNDRLAIIVQIEGEDGLTAAPGISRVPGIDAVFVGTYDLSQALGIPGDIASPRLVAAGAELRRGLCEECRLGVYVSTEEMVRQWRSVGVSVFTFGTDGQWLLAGARLAAAALRAGRS
jgi:4-hydroxy-2-oxoheptanedioate aldolase